MEQTLDIYYRYGGAIKNVEFGASSFYKSDKVMQATRQKLSAGRKSAMLRLQRKTRKRLSKILEKAHDNRI